VRKPSDSCHGRLPGSFHLGESHRGYLSSRTVNFPPISGALIETGRDDDIAFESFSSDVADRALRNA
jgi:hypothetical protein